MLATSPKARSKLHSHWLFHHDNTTSGKMATVVAVFITELLLICCVSGLEAPDQEVFEAGTGPTYKFGEARPTRYVFGLDLITMISEMLHLQSNSNGNTRPANNSTSPASVQPRPGYPGALWTLG